MMGRMSAYTGQEITWDMAMNSKEDTMPANLDWKMKLPVPRFGHSRPDAFRVNRIVDGLIVDATSRATASLPRSQVGYALA